MTPPECTLASLLESLTGVWVTAASPKGLPCQGACVPGMAQLHEALLWVIWGWAPTFSEGLQRPCGQGRASMSFSRLWGLWLWGLRCLLQELRLKATCQQQSPYSVQLLRAVFPPSIHHTAARAPGVQVTSPPPGPIPCSPTKAFGCLE